MAVTKRRPPWSPFSGPKDYSGLPRGSISPGSVAAASHVRGFPREDGGPGGIVWGGATNQRVPMKRVQKRPRPA